jgi:hypothetical protein
MQQVRSQVHVRAFFLSLDDARILLRLAGNRHERHRDFMGQKMPVVDRHAGQRLHRLEVELLPHRLVRVVRTGADTGGEVFDFHDGVFRKQ